MVTEALAGHIASALSRPLPDAVRQKGCLHIIDTIAAMVSGTELAAGRQALPFAAAMGGAPEASVIGSGVLTNSHSAALANGILAHSDETDDSHAASLTHPGCAVIPAALASAERLGRSGDDFVKAVVAGYDVGTRIATALGGDHFFELGHSSHAFGGVFGATAAACAVAGHDARQAAFGLAYAVQMASGNACWRRDPDHIEKAFDFAGMPAHNGALAERMVSAGFTGSARPLDAEPNLFTAFPAHARPELAVEGLGQRYAVMETAIKKWCVGSPIQAALDSMTSLMQEAPFHLDDIEGITVALPRHAAPVVDNKPMPAVNLQHQMTVLIHEGTLTFASTHDEARFAQQNYREFAHRIAIDPRSDQSFIDIPRQAIVTLRFKNGDTRSHRTLHVRGTPANPMDADEIVAKATDLMNPVLGAQQTQALIARLLQAQDIADMRELRPLWTRPGAPS
ncbi:MAG TPA: MmgE/PrpD family protein [Herbaspirillum sp.]|jgi:2-methylcitrate dehydratase PrpD